jgi:hypothetical protein
VLAIETLLAVMYAAAITREAMDEGIFAEEEEIGLAEVIAALGIEGAESADQKKKKRCSTTKEIIWD